MPSTDTTVSSTLIPSPNSAFTPWDRRVPSPPNPSSNIEENNSGVIRPKPIRVRKRKYEDITPNQLGMYPPITISDSESSDSESSDNESESESETEKECSDTKSCSQDYSLDDLYGFDDILYKPFK